MNEPKPAEKDDDDKSGPSYRCMNSDCRAFEAILEPDEIITNETTGIQACCYCGTPVTMKQE
jgi:hypothetical protein